MKIQPVRSTWSKVPLFSYDHDSMFLRSCFSCFWTSINRSPRTTLKAWNTTRYHHFFLRSPSMKETKDTSKKTNRKRCRIREDQKASRSVEKLATVWINTVIPAGISSMFTQDLPVANKSPINMPQKIQGMTSATARVVLILSPHSSCL